MSNLFGIDSEIWGIMPIDTLRDITAYKEITELDPDIERG